MMDNVGYWKVFSGKNNVPNKSESIILDTMLLCLWLVEMGFFKIISCTNAPIRNSQARVIGE
jgi:hypothetical protein